MTELNSQPEPVDPGHDPGVDPSPDDDAVDRAEAIDEPQAQEDSKSSPEEDPSVDTTDGGFPSSPDLDDENTDARSGEPGAAAG